jgi:hypothetical protein
MMPASVYAPTAAGAAPCSVLPATRYGHLFDAFDARVQRVSIDQPQRQPMTTAKISGLKNLSAYTGRVAARPAVQEALKAEGLLK